MNFIRKGLLSSKSGSDVPIWAACESLLSCADLSNIHCGFFPYIPHPITEQESYGIAYPIESGDFTSLHR